MGYPIQQGSTDPAADLKFLMIDASDHISPKTGLSPTVQIEKSGGIFAAPAGAVSEVGNGWYRVAANATDNAILGPLILHGSATGADPTDEQYDIVSYNPALIYTAPPVLGQSVGQVLLDTMKMLKPELQVSSGGSDVTRALVALNRAQDAFESLYAQYPGGRYGISGSVVTTAQVESTTYPVGLLRLDSLWLLSNGFPVYEIITNKDVGAQANGRGWPYYLITPNGTGRPRTFSSDGVSIYWGPVPDAAYTIRWRGFQAAGDISVAGVFAYEDFLILPIASLAVKLISIGLDDDPANISTLAADTLKPAIDTLQAFNRSGPASYTYRYNHST